MGVWKSNKQVLVGFSPRIQSYDIVSGKIKYMRWQHTWWTGMYDIMLTKACILHRAYLADYIIMIPDAFLGHIDQNKNCEDIAMAHVVARKSKAAPVWIQGIIYETSSKGISSGTSHFVDRGECLSLLRTLTKVHPWVTGYQKMVPIGVFDIW
eukprot:CAMPEP_0119034790 /NCGR_PEP_ID=MMETSP1177-20130426/1801_1 /TAXON_ID=2985 /ORGANISM="Ochromonas sp, Strain CCMP1899" /LENGTH=152 /DNA_ID=CAMNT_0006992493 /DNA_START=593 /DNA_END=1048 /DNA_ORIENTATION=-